MKRNVHLYNMQPCNLFICFTYYYCWNNWQVQCWIIWRQYTHKKLQHIWEVQSQKYPITILIWCFLGIDETMFNLRFQIDLLFSYLLAKHGHGWFMAAVEIETNTIWLNFCIYTYVPNQYYCAEVGEVKVQLSRLYTFLHSLQQIYIFLERVCKFYINLSFFTVQNGQE